VQLRTSHRDLPDNRLYRARRSFGAFRLACSARARHLSREKVSFLQKKNCRRPRFASPLECRARKADPEAARTLRSFLNQMPNHREVKPCFVAMELDDRVRTVSRELRFELNNAGQDGENVG